MRVVLLARRLDAGGAERQLCALALGLRRSGVDVHVVVFYGGGWHDSELRDAGVPLHDIGKHGRWDIAGFVGRMLGVLRTLKPDVLYAFLDIPNIAAVLLKPLIGSPSVIWGIRAAGMEIHHYDRVSRFAIGLETFLRRCPDRIIANSTAGERWAVERGFPKRKLAVVENGIDTDRFRPIDGASARSRLGLSATSVVLGMVARFDVMKDHTNLISAFARVARSCPEAVLLCAGSGAQERQQVLHATAVREGVADRIRWLGNLSDVTSVYGAMDVCVLSSAFGEGFPNVVGEAMACGVPCVVTDVGDSARVVGEEGIVVPPRDPEALAAGILEMLQRKASDSDQGLRCRRRIQENFSVDRMVEKTALAIAVPLSKAPPQ